jgi:putative hydrolase of the HAD superfamily
MIRAVVFDCFGVLYRSSADELYDRCPEVARDELHDIRLQRDRGIMSYREYLEAAALLLKIPTEEVRAITEQAHVRNQGLFDYIVSLDRSRYKVGMLSNIGDTTIGQLFSHDELDGFFDATVFSYEVGMVKPDPAIYQLMCQRLGCDPEESIMIDDIERNCEGARAIGMQAIVHQSNTETLHVLNNL